MLKSTRLSLVQGEAGSRGAEKYVLQVQAGENIRGEFQGKNDFSLCQEFSGIEAENSMHIFVLH